jgi:hypothetical protein
MSRKKGRAEERERRDVPVADSKSLAANDPVLDLCSSELDDALAIDDARLVSSVRAMGDRSGQDASAFWSSFEIFDHLAEDRDHWRERAVLWHERAIAAELAARMLQRNLDDLRAHIQDLRDGAPASPSTSSLMRIVHAWYAEMRQLFEGLYVKIRTRRAVELSCPKHDDSASDPNRRA